MLFRSFVIKSITSKGKDNGSKAGTISIKGQKYMLKQGKMEIISDGKTVWNYDGSKTITVSDASENTNTLSPQNLLSNFYDKDFNYKLLGSKDGFDEIELVPIDKRKNFSKVNVFVDKTKNMITKAKIVDKTLVVNRKWVKNPVAVRYMFNNTGIGNIFNKAGLPLNLFRTDDWKVNTEVIKK